jgi:hypothetical protein
VGAGVALLLLLLLLGSGLSEDASCRDWLDASEGEQRDFVEERARGQRVPPEDVRALATGTCRFAVRSRSRRVTADAAVRSAVRSLSPAAEPEF